MLCSVTVCDHVTLSFEPCSALQCSAVLCSALGFSADAPVYTAEGAVAGVQLRDVGIGKDGKEKDTFEPGHDPMPPVTNNIGLEQIHTDTLRD